MGVVHVFRYITDEGLVRNFSKTPFNSTSFADAPTLEQLEAGFYPAFDPAPPGKGSVVSPFRRIHNNLLIANYNALAGVLLDDGGARVLSYNNVIAYGQWGILDLGLILTVFLSTSCTMSPTTCREVRSSRLVGLPVPPPHRLPVLVSCSSVCPAIQCRISLPGAGESCHQSQWVYMVGNLYAYTTLAGFMISSEGPSALGTRTFVVNSTFMNLRDSDWGQIDSYMNYFPEEHMNLTQWWNNSVHSPTGKTTGPAAKGGGNCFSGPLSDQKATDLAATILAPYPKSAAP